MKSKVLQLLKLKVSDLKEFQGDFKKLSKKQFEKLKLSIQNNGFIQPFFVWQKENNFFILDGHQRKKAIIDLYGNDLQVDCLQVEAESELEAKKFVIFYSSSYGEFTKESFFNFAQDLNFKDIEPFQFPGFSFSENDFLKGLDSESDDEIPDVVQNECGVQLGDIYTIGDHRLMCGDSTDLKTVEKLMDGKKADMVFTDPPYGVEFQSNRSVKSKKFDVLKNDHQIIDFLPTVEQFSKGWVFVWTSWKVQNQWIDNFRALNYPTNIVIWHKPGGGIGDLKKTFSSDYEVALVWNRGEELCGKRIGSVWTFNKDGAIAYQHPTQKPVALAVEAITKTTNQSTSILDLFGGSGSTIIACEKLNRKCFMMEIDPHYCSVIIKRWENFTGKKAVKL